MPVCGTGSGGGGCGGTTAPCAHLRLLLCFCLYTSLSNAAMQGGAQLRTTRLQKCVAKNFAAGSRNRERGFRQSPANLINNRGDSAASSVMFGAAGVPLHVPQAGLNCQARPTDSLIHPS